MKNFFKDDTGKVVIGQKPSLPILVWAGASALSYVPLPVLADEILSLIAFGAVFTWSWLEMFDGVNLFRKILGLVVMCLAITFAL